MELLVYLLCITFVLMNVKWLFILFMLPWMAFDKFRDRGKVGYVLSLPYRLSERILRGGGNEICYISYRNHTFK